MHKYHLTIDTSYGDSSGVERYLLEIGLVDHFDSDSFSNAEDSGEKNTIAFVINKDKFDRYIKRKTPIDDFNVRNLIKNCLYMGKVYERKTPKKVKTLMKEMDSKIPF